MIKSKKQMFIVIGVFTLVLMLVTTTYAFFNYTRTGLANTIRTGRISFNHTQGSSINLTNMFPIDVSEGIPNDNTKVGTLTINVTGDTTYTEGLEYLVTATNVTNTVGNKSLPISIDVSVSNNTNNDPATTLGTSDSNYFTNRGGNTSIYKVLANDTINNDDNLVVGYIAPGVTGVDGNIVIKAYLDDSKIAITDTYDGNETDNMGTTSSWVGDRTVFTTTEWNSLQTNGVSFQIKVEANEDVWVTDPTPKTATFDTGPVVNTKFKLLSINGEYTGQDLSEVDTYELNISSPPYHLTTDYPLLGLVKEDVEPDTTQFTSVNIISSSSSDVPIYAWYDINDEFIHWYTDSNQIYLNEDSSYMFRRFDNFGSQSGLDIIDASRAVNMSGMFIYAGENDEYLTSLSNWDVSNVTNMSRMFAFVFWGQSNVGVKDASAINGWDVSNVTNFNNMFIISEENGYPSQFTYPDFSSHKPNYHWDNSVDGQDEWGWDLYKGSYVPNN